MITWMSLVDSGPLSRPIQPSGIASTSTVWRDKKTTVGGNGEQSGHKCLVRSHT